MTYNGLIKLLDDLKREGVTKTEFAKKCGISRTRVSDIINKRRDCKISTTEIEKICKAYKCSPNDLVEVEE